MPLSHVPGERRLSDHASGGAMEGSRKTILVVDDDERIRTALQHGLSLSGYRR